MKDTAVKFLIDEILCRFIISEELRIAMYKAIEMEKEQIIDSLMTSEVELLSWGISAEQYYKQTFKSE
tara:strand:- start:1076 stop:1279 length:204 start_codon:yes stop_codon:yes gene_type:complete